MMALMMMLILVLVLLLLLLLLLLITTTSTRTTTRTMMPSILSNSRYVYWCVLITYVIIYLIFCVPFTSRTPIWSSTVFPALLVACMSASVRGKYGNISTTLTV
ncbi:hypothetical protein DPMN_144193 [Dreissena polymorpha]|uniref:Uncharacterized protein n=1 Tax=Dreissena polymorpha TaxID=45954 RepID=A0A9D4JPZ7_DREPO|nr:hypothetical protein DPMN_144193 [Dreissena polymorpha]